MSNPDIEHDNQNKKQSDHTEQANPSVTVHIHAPEDEEEDVRGSVPREEENDPGERDSPVDSRESIVKFKDGGITNVQIVARHDQGRSQGFRESRQRPSYQGQDGPPQGGHYDQGAGYPQGQGAHVPQQGAGYPQGQGGYVPQPGGYYHPQGQGGYGPQQGGYYYPPAQGGYGQNQGNYYGPNQNQYYGPPPPPPPPHGQGRQPIQDGPPPSNNSGRGWSSMASGVPMEKTHRGPFIRKVFTMLFICMAATTAFAISTFIIPGTRELFASPIGTMLGIFGLMLSFAMTYVMMCSECSRRAPCNCICLVLVVTAECLIFGFLTARFKLKVILLALTVTTIIVLVCLGLAFTSLDFTKCYMFILVAAIALMVFFMVFMIVRLVFQEVFPVVHLVLAMLFTVVQSIIFIMQIQMIIGGRTLELDVDEWAIATFMLYTSIMTIFFDILSIFNIADYL